MPAAEFASGPLEEAFDAGKRITLQSHLLSESGEQSLERMVEFVFQRLGHRVVGGPIYAAVRELVQNAAKANMKRVLFEELEVDPAIESQYAEAMLVFREQLIASQLKRFGPRIRELGLFFRVCMDYSSEVVSIAVINDFGLYEPEERRIRQKFIQAGDIDSLVDYFVHFSDSAEGAGMGIAMVKILLQQAGLVPRGFSIFTVDGNRRTVARLIVPLTKTYKMPRDRFTERCLELGCRPEELRAKVHAGEVSFPIFSDRALNRPL
ncbi:MAG: hypothetical protein H7A21_06355 [Spirochaetales bacterium]|nr:hypothetical protein [Spirochaetales bacterium]MCP5485414.1 hypothetical protein [Spirochaetales bacterium]